METKLVIIGLGLFVIYIVLNIIAIIINAKSQWRIYRHICERDKQYYLDSTEIRVALSYFTSMRKILDKKGILTDEELYASTDEEYVKRTNDCMNKKEEEK